jgi:hypothetical protein
VAIKLWQLVSVIAAATFLVGLLAGRYVFPHKSAKTQAIEALLAGSGEAFTENADESTAQANVRAAVPALEAYNADNGRGYSGATIPLLRLKYDAGIRDVQLRWANQSDYCLESTSGSATYHKDGPAGQILSGPCTASP